MIAARTSSSAPATLALCSGQGQPLRANQHPGGLQIVKLPFRRWPVRREQDLFARFLSRIRRSLDWLCETPPTRATSAADACSRRAAAISRSPAIDDSLRREGAAIATNDFRESYPRGTERCCAIPARPAASIIARTAAMRRRERSETLETRAAFRGSDSRPCRCGSSTTPPPIVIGGD